MSRRFKSGPMLLKSMRPLRISFASSFLTGTAANLWYTVVAGNRSPATWEEFEGAIWNEFIPFDSEQRSRDTLRRLVQRTSVSDYLSEFRNIVLMILGVNEGEQLDRFCQSLKPHVRLEVLKPGARITDEAARIALNVDSTMFTLPKAEQSLAQISEWNFLLDYRRNGQWIMKLRVTGIRSRPIVCFTSGHLQS